MNVLLTAMMRRFAREQRRTAPDPMACSSYEEVRARSAVLAYVVGEGHQDETTSSLARRFSPIIESAAIEAAVNDLVAQEFLGLEGDKVIAGPVWGGSRFEP